MKIADIRIGERHRRDMGDIESLATNIKEIGLLHPVVVTSENELVAGARRIAAHRHLNRTTIATRVIDLEKLVLGEYAENSFRKQFTPTELVEIVDAIEPIERAKAKERQAEHGGTAPGRKSTSGKFPEVSGNALDKVAKIVGKDRKTIQKARAVRDAAEAEPEKFGELVKKMDETGKIDGAFKKLKQAEKDELRAAKVLLPDGKFDVIVMDPPWAMEKIERDVRPNQITIDYPTMSEEELVAYRADLEPRIADDCHFFLWTTHKFLPMALRLLDAWELKYVCTFVWHKSGGYQPVGLPQFNCEFVLYARRGTPRFIDTKDFFCCFDAPRREHSRKPDEFYAVLVRVTDGRRVEWFAREARPGFTAIGNETGKFSEAVAA